MRARKGIIPGGRIGLAPVSDDNPYPEAHAAGLRQADDLLSNDDAGAGGNTRDPDYLGRTGFAAWSAAHFWRAVRRH
jgi:hypothetical protein